MPCDKKRSNSITRRSKSLILSMALILAACAETQVGVQSGAKSRYQAIAVVPHVNDNLLSVYRKNEFSQPWVTEARMGWDANSGAGQIAKEILGRAGASVTVTRDQHSGSAKAADAVVILRQTPLDQFAQRYNPEQDLMLNVISIAAAASAGGIAYIIIDDERRYRPRSILEIRKSDGSGPNHCAVGITPALSNAKTGELLKQGRSLMGVEKLPGRLSGHSWQQLTPSERSTVLAYCQSALRRAISQSFVELGLVR
ncbi:hypothetical protein ACXYMO_02645 [Arenibacterium sp. CAU 1754]